MPGRNYINYEHLSAPLLLTLSLSSIYPAPTLTLTLTLTLILTLTLTAQLLVAEIRSPIDPKTNLHPVL